MWERMSKVNNVGFHKDGKPVTWRTFSDTFGFSKSEAKKFLRDMSKDEIWTNNTYSVSVRRRVGPGFFDATKEVYSGFPKESGEVVWLSIKRHDKEPIHDWRDLQRIKNEVVGEKAEAMEIYPAESRLMDASNQYHLCALHVGIPLGFVGRAVKTPEEAELVGAKQRAF